MLQIEIFVKRISGRDFEGELWSIFFRYCRCGFFKCCRYGYLWIEFPEKMWVVPIQIGIFMDFPRLRKGSDLNIKLNLKWCLKHRKIYPWLQNLTASNQTISSVLLSFHHCSSQPSMVHWLSSPIFPCSFVRLFGCPAMVTPVQISLLVAPHPKTHTFSESLW